MCEQEQYLPLRVRPASEEHCHRTCKSLYSLHKEAHCGGGNLYFCAFCDHSRVEETPEGNLMRLEYCRDYTTSPGS